MLEPGVPECTSGLDADQAGTNALDFEDLRFQSALAPDTSFGEWSSFGNDVHPSFSDHSTLSPACLPSKHQDVKNPHVSGDQFTCSKKKIFESSDLEQMFHSCFPCAGDSSEVPATAEARPLSELLYGAPGSPASCSEVSRAATLWSRLLIEPRCPELSRPSRRPPRSHSALLSALSIAPAVVAAQQGALPAERDPEENDGETTSPRTVALIQTKLLPPPQFREGRGFLYQISHQWLSQCSLGLQGRNPQRSFLP
ncbi:uncharacterized protein LOC108919394 [Scleropages formosus]|uniref:uncharacterized protein LOC108919394 n=1 Tax=Scleropages formosus TaxID=113540 RepID=UPI0010FAA0C6|nr:uncharacterized protein LOC108919394 [Scleropages formosus]